jgi:predicted AlkP superfamily pyrophosphatase or phosphodiesterase
VNRRRPGKPSARGAGRLLLIACICALVLPLGCSRAANGKRVIVLGFDGLDYDLTKSLIDNGRLPNFAKLAASGGFSPLGTSIPPQSPVAWSTFITGLDPGGHGG